MRLCLYNFYIVGAKRNLTALFWMKGDLLMKFKKIITRSFITFFVSFLALSVPVLAAEPTVPEESTITASESAINPCSDITGYRYKEENGKLYRRLYNYTRGEWAEPYWHLVG